MATTDFSNHNFFKEQVITLLEAAKDTFNNHFGEEKKADIDAFSELIETTKNGRFSIMVVGEFSAGKSTFLNALMQEKYLDSFSSETTANINFLKSVKDSPTGKPMIKVNYKDGSVITSDDVNFDNIQKYVSTKGEDVAAKIDSVEIFLDSKFLNEGVTLIDSPGLNGLKALHADITKNQMKASHAAIFMFRATQPGSKSDFQTLLNLKKVCKSIIIVLNRIDEAAKVGEETVEEIVSKLKENFKTFFPNEKIPEIWPISAYKALVARSKKGLDYNGKLKHTDEDKEEFLQTSLMKPFEKRLLKYITQGEKAKNELMAPVDKVLAIVEETINDINTEEETLNGTFSLDEIEAQIEAITNEKKNLEATIANKKHDMEDAIADSIRNAKTTIKSDTKDIKDRFLEDLSSEENLNDLERNFKFKMEQMKSKYESVYSDALETLQSDIKSALRRNIEGSLKIINSKLSDICKSDNPIFSKSIEIDDSQFNADIDRAKNDELISNKKLERKNALEKQYQAEDMEIEAQNLKRRLSDINNERMQLNAQHSDNLRSLSDPGVYWRTEYEERKEKKWRWLGCIGDEYKTYTVPKQVADYSGHNLYVEKKQQIEKEYKSQLGSLEDEKLRVEAELSKYSHASLQSRRYQMERDNIEREINELEEQRKKDISYAIKKQLSQAKKYVTDYFDDLEKNSRKSVLKELDEKEDELYEHAKSILEGEIKGELDIKTNKLESLKAKRDLAEKDKNERLDSIKNAKTALEDLKEKADSVREVIESIKIDTIKEQ
ncbi:MAG: dynamin family protein [Muribaculaceae bacterium]